MGIIGVKYLGHSSFLLNVGSKKILTDPYFSSTPLGTKKRLVPCAVDVFNLPKIDTILVSHEHMDSCDADSINYLCNRYDCSVISHESVLNKLSISAQNKISIDEFDTKKMDDIEITAYPAHHPSSFYPLSFLIKEKGGKSVFFAGDTFMTNEHDLIKPTIAILPIGGKRTMDISSAVRVSKKMAPEYLIPMHYNTFDDIKVNANLLKYKLEDTRYPIKTVILNPGQLFKI
ncbi:MAG TPA: MBL fold metallo-hydrolase [archaeon]|nr:MBL fold metallo-hydrolase [archaeon]